MRINDVDVDPDELTPSAIQLLLNAGFTQTDIARMFGVSRQAVNKQAVKYGLHRQTRQELLAEVWPFPPIRRELGNTDLFARLRDHAAYQLTGKLSDEKLGRLRSFLTKLLENDFVVEYDPDIPPQPGVASRGGFTYRKRRKSDKGLIIRPNDYTDKDVLAKHKKIWTFPDDMP